MAGSKDLKLQVVFAGIDRLSGVLGGISGATRKAGAALRDTNKSIGAQQKELAALQRDLPKATGNVTALVDREKALTASIARGTQELEERTAAYKRLSNMQEKYQKSQEIGDKLQSGGAKAIGVGAAVAAPVVVSVNAAMDMEESMAGVKKVTGMKDPAIAQMNSDLLDMSTRIPMAATELGNIAAAAGAAGVGMDKNGKAMADQRQQLLTFTEDASKMGIAFDMSADEAGATMAKWRTSFGLGQEGVRALGDQVNALTNKFGGKADAVSDIITRIGPLGSVAGVAAPQIAALGSTLNSIGVENEVAATGIKNMMLSLTAGAKATKGQSAAFKSLGLDATDVSKRMQTDAAGTITDVMERIQKLDKSAQPGMLKELFGSESIGAIAPLLTNLDGLKKRLGLVGDEAAYSGSMQGEFLSRISTTKGAVGLALNSLQAVNIELGQKLLPYVVSAANWVKSVAVSFRDWAKANPELASGIAQVVALIAGLLVSFGGIAVAGGTLMKTWSVISLGAKMAVGPLKILPKIFGVVRFAAMFLAKGIMRAGMMMLANPMVLAIVAIGAALGVVGYLIYTHWDTISAAFKSGVAAVSGVLSSLGDFFSGLWNNIKSAFATGVAAVGSVFSVLGQLFQVQWNIVKAVFALGVAAIGLAWTGLKVVISAGIAAVTAVFSTVGAIFSKGWNAIKGAFSAGLTALKGMLPSFKNIGSMMLEGLISMLSPGRLIGHIVGLGKSAISAFKNVLGIHSPSRVFADLGGHVMGGLALGIDKRAEEPLNRTRRVAGDLTTAMAATAMTFSAPSLATAMTANANTRFNDSSLASVSAAAGAAPRAGAGGMGADTGARGGDTYNITIQAAPGQNEQQLVAQLERLLEKIEREKAARRRSGYRDYDA